MANYRVIYKKRKKGEPYQGQFVPGNPQKYKGDPSKIIFRSSWELDVMKRLDEAPEVEWWASEEIAIPYTCPVRRSQHRYFVDFLVKYKNGKQKMIEIKPFKETHRPPAKGRLTKKAVQEHATWMINEAKWRAARELCEKAGWEFVVLTEKGTF